LIALLGSGASDAPASLRIMTELKSALPAAGLVERRDYVLKAWWANSDSSRFPALAETLLAEHPAAVVVSTILAAKAVQARSRSVPIVMTGLNDPIGAGLVASLAHPGGNITGVANMAEDVLLKTFEIARAVMPRLHNVAAMSNPTNPSHRSMLDSLQRYAATAGLSITTVEVAAPADLDAAIAGIARARPEALFVLTDSSLAALSDMIVSRALSLGVATIGSFSPDFARAGALVTYTRDYSEAFRSVAGLLKKILAGASPADLPVEEPTKFVLYINLKTAKMLGLAVPASVQLLADEVIE